MPEECHDRADHGCRALRSAPNARNHPTHPPADDPGIPTPRVRAYLAGAVSAPDSAASRGARGDFKVDEATISRSRREHQRAHRRHSSAARRLIDAPSPPAASAPPRTLNLGTLAKIRDVTDNPDGSRSSSAGARDLEPGSPANHRSFWLARHGRAGARAPGANAKLAGNRGQQGATALGIPPRALVGGTLMAAQLQIDATASFAELR